MKKYLGKLVFVLLTIIVWSFGAAPATAQEVEASTPPPSVATNVYGDLNTLGFEPGGARGWLYDPDHPERKVLGAFVVDGQYVHFFEADKFRQDIKDSYLNGDYAFEEGTPRVLRDGGHHTFQLKALDNDSGQWAIISSSNDVYYGPTITGFVTYKGQPVSSTKSPFPIATVYKVGEYGMTVVAGTDLVEKDGVIDFGRLKFLARSFLDGSYYLVVEGKGTKKTVVPFEIKNAENVDLGTITIEDWALPLKVTAVYQQYGYLRIGFNGQWDNLENKGLVMLVFGELAPEYTRKIHHAIRLGEFGGVWASVVVPAPSNRLGWESCGLVQFVNENNLSDVVGEVPLTCQTIGSGSVAPAAMADGIDPANPGEQRVRVTKK